MTTSRRTTRGTGSSAARPSGASAARSPAGAAKARPARPAAAARVRHGGRDPRADLPAPPPASPWLRWGIVAAILVVLLVTLVPTARSLLRQRAQITSLSEQVARQEVTVAALQAEQQRWQDPAYVEQQARERLKFVKVGDRSYTVIDAADAPRPTVTGATVAAPAARGDAPWYGQVWQSVTLADRPTAGMATPR